LKLFVKFTCGCIGINPTITTPDPFPILIKPCDIDPWDLSSGSIITFHAREDLANKGYELLPDEEQSAMIVEIWNLINDGHSLRRVKRALDI
jgi:hypothetical protein